MPSRRLFLSLATSTAAIVLTAPTISLADGPPDQATKPKPKKPLNAKEKRAEKNRLDRCAKNLKEIRNQTADQKFWRAEILKYGSQLNRDKRAVKKLDSEIKRLERVRKSTSNAEKATQIKNALRKAYAELPTLERKQHNTEVKLKKAKDGLRTTIEAVARLRKDLAADKCKVRR